MKLSRDIIAYAIFGTILLIIGMAAQNLYEIQKTIDRAEHLQQHVPVSSGTMMQSEGVELD